jgi:hypothetical protein
LWLLPTAAVLAGGLLVVAARSEEKTPPPPGPQAPPKESPHQAKEERPLEGPPAGEEARAAEVLAVAPPPFSPGIFPCSSCHEDLTPNPTPRKLTRKHKDIVLHHDEQNRWCYDCHTSGNLDKLHLASGKPVEFTESYKLCGQCHGPTLRDWRAGEHGKRTGSWSGKKEYLLCASCHSPHSPKFQPLKPLPPPVRPRDLR